jgi:hypothetical protein
LRGIADDMRGAILMMEEQAIGNGWVR